MTVRTRLISAVGTPLTARDEVDVPSLRRHLADQWAAGIDGVLVGGTMGLMQMLTDDAFRVMAETAAEAEGGELLLGVGDTSLGRTLAKIELAGRLPIDGVVVLAPYFMRLSQGELLDYFKAIADASQRPVYLYDLPQRVGYAIENETTLRLCGHPNIAGIKCSGPLQSARELRDAAPGGFRVIVAQPQLVDVLIPGGFREHLDGMFALAPEWSAALRDAADAGVVDDATRWQRMLNELLKVLLSYGVMGAFSAIQQARGLAERWAPRPLTVLDDAARRRLLDEPLVRELLACVREGAIERVGA